jgi:hypothetical protein
MEHLAGSAWLASSHYGRGKRGEDPFILRTVAVESLPGSERSICRCVYASAGSYHLLKC